MADNPRVHHPGILLLDRYRVEGVLGEGGLGTVVKAFDTRLKRFVAIKTLQRALAMSDAALFRAVEERFTREAEAGARLGTHPNIVAVYDLVMDEHRTQHLILEYVAGGTVAERIAGGPLSLADALMIAVDSAQGLHAAHEAGIVHRDVKPSNIFLTETSRAKVGDFGIAQIDAISARTRTITGHPGTPLYMSPEQTHSTGYVHPESDQYSLGLVLFEMLTGDAYKRLRRGQIAERLASLSPAVRRLIETMTANDPEERFASMREVAEAIEQARSSASKPTMASTVRDGDNEDDILTVPDGKIRSRGTPPINLLPAVPIAPPPPVPAASPRRHSRRAILLGAGGLILGASGVGGIFAATHRGGPGPVSTATPGAPVANVAPTSTVLLSSPLAPANPTPTTAMASGAPQQSTAPISSSAPSETPVLAPAPQAAPSVQAKGPAPITALLTYMDGRVTLPGEGEDNGIITGGPVRVIGLDLSRGEPLPLPSVTTPEGTRTVRVLWAPKGTLLATLVRQPVAGGFSRNLDLVVSDIATGKSTTVATAINTLAAWSPDGTTLMYGLETGTEQVKQYDNGTPVPAGTNFSTTGYDVHLVSADGMHDRVIAHLQPTSMGCGRGGPVDPIEAFLAEDQFFGGGISAAWAADGSRIAMTVRSSSFTMRPDGTDIKAVAGCSTPDLGNYIGPITSDLYSPANGIQIRLVDDADALQWRYERGMMPTTILSGCTLASGSATCDNTRKGTANAGYRNQIVARLPDGSERQLTNSPTFKYHVQVSPDGTAVAFTGITVTDYTEAAKMGQYFAGYSVDVYLVRLGDTTETRLSRTGTGHHPSWQRDIPVTLNPHPTATPRPTDPPQPTPTPRPNPTRGSAVSPVPAGTLVVWADPQGHLRLTYPRNWSPVPATDTGEIFELDSRDGVHLSIYASHRSDTIQAGMNDYIARQNRRTGRKYSFGATKSGYLGGVPALYTDFVSAATSGAPDVHTAEIAYASSGGWLFAFEYYTEGTAWRRTDDIVAILNSVQFTV